MFTLESHSELSRGDPQSITQHRSAGLSVGCAFLCCLKVTSGHMVYAGNTLKNANLSDSFPVTRSGNSFWWTSLTILRGSAPGNLTSTGRVWGSRRTGSVTTVSIVQVEHGYIGVVRLNQRRSKNAPRPDTEVGGGTKTFRFPASFTRAA